MFHACVAEPDREVGSTLPGGDEWLKSPGARGALDAYAREGVRAPFEDDAETDDASALSGTEGDGTDGSTTKTPSETETVAKSVSVSPSPPPFSERQLADELRKKINRLRVAARRASVSRTSCSSPRSTRANRCSIGRTVRAANPSGARKST